VKNHSATLKKIGDALNTGDDKGVVIAVAAALLIIAGVVAGYYILFHPTPEGYTTIYLLDSQGKAVDYPGTLIVNQNYTFNVWIENHMGKTLPFEVRVKITEQVNPDFPVPGKALYVDAVTLENGGKWNTTATTTIDTPSNYMVVYELWAQNENSGTLEFTGNACVLNVEAINQT